MTRCKLRYERLLEVLHYDPLTGAFTWVRPTSTCVKTGQKAGLNRNSWGYARVRVDGQLFGAHILAWLYMTGEWPAADIDHINGDRADNRWANLSTVSRAVNMQNLKRAHRDSETGLLSVSRHRKAFAATIMVRGRKHRLGTFPTAKQAHQVYLSAKRVLHEGNTL